jgi:signal transduction histidine kinase
MFRAEQKQTKTKASSLLNDALFLELSRSMIERYDQLAAENIEKGKEVRAASYEEKTITVYVAYPERKKIVRKCETDEEWYEYAKDVYTRYHYWDNNMIRLDSAYKAALKKNDIALPFVLMKMDSLHTILEQLPAEADYRRYQLSSDTIPLGIDGKDFLLARFDNSYYGMFRQMKNMIFTSFGLVFLLAVILIYLVNTIFHQKKIAEVREDFVNSVVHDLMNPVTYLKKILSCIKTDESQQVYIRTAKRKNERMSLLIEKLLMTSSAEKKIDIHPVPLRIGEYIRSIVDPYNEDNDDFDIRFTGEDRLGMANMDSLHFGNAVINLIDNAIKYSEGIPDIIVRCYEEGGFVCVSVKDHGVGIPQEYVPFLFEKNFRVPEQKSLRRYGFGLGLYYVKIVMKAHGGDVTVKSEYKKGSTFTVRLPAVKNKNSEAL